MQLHYERKTFQEKHLLENMANEVGVSGFVSSKTKPTV
jgi:hypothetical protein